MRGRRVEWSEMTDRDCAPSNVRAVNVYYNDDDDDDDDDDDVPTMRILPSDDPILFVCSPARWIRHSSTYALHLSQPLTATATVFFGYGYRRTAAFDDDGDCRYGAVQTEAGRTVVGNRDQQVEIS